MIYKADECAICKERVELINWQSPSSYRVFRVEARDYSRGDPSFQKPEEDFYARFCEKCWLERIQPAIEVEIEAARQKPSEGLVNGVKMSERSDSGVLNMYSIYHARAVRFAAPVKSTVGLAYPDQWVEASRIREKFRAEILARMKGTTTDKPNDLTRKTKRKMEI